MIRSPVRFQSTSNDGQGRTQFGRVSGESIAEYLQAAIFAPADMSRTLHLRAADDPTEVEARRMDALETVDHLLSVDDPGRVQEQRSEYTLLRLLRMRRNTPTTSSHLDDPQFL